MKGEIKMLSYPGSLHGHTDFSNLRLRDSINRYNELIDYAIELGHECIAITEHETVANAIKIEKYRDKIKEKHPDFKIILGNEIYLCRDTLEKDTVEQGEQFYHFILLAKDAVGHQQIREISTRAWKRSWQGKLQKRVPTHYQDLIDIIAKNSGHVIGSTACLGGYLPQTLIKTNEIPTAWLNSMVKLFGKDNFFLEMQPSNQKEQIFVNQKLYEISKQMDIPFIITCDEHYLKKEDREIHADFLRSQDGDRELDDFYASTYLMDTNEIKEYLNYFSDEILQEAFDNIRKIKDMCENYSLRKPLRIPNLKWKPVINLLNIETYFGKIPNLKKFYESDFKGDRILAQKIFERIVQDKTLQNKETYDAVNDCLDSTWVSSEVNKTHWSSYYLNLENIIDVCWDAGTLIGPGRGSGIGYILLYLLNITQINPLRETVKTYPWRFLNPSRVSVLDVDIDIEGSKRSAVLNRLREVYGEDRVANVATFGTETSKQAIQTAARGLGIDNTDALYLSSLIPSDRGQNRTLKQCFYGDPDNDMKPIPEFVYAMTEEFPELWRVAQRIEGLVCKIGEHAGGVIFVDEPFTNSTALMRAPNGDIITQFDLHDAEAVSLIKYDLLSVECLDKIHTCIDLLEEYGYVKPKATLKETYEDILGIYNIERDNPDMWKMVWNHEINSLFQMEQQSGIQGIALTKPESVEDLAHLNSIIRLMAQEKGAEQPLNKYARFKNDITLWYKEMQDNGLTKKEQDLLKPILQGSYGIAESQESFMRLVQIPECGGFDLNFADRLRKSIAKKNPAEYEKLTEEYFKTIKEKGLSENLCTYVWNTLVATSRGYGFNAAHTLAYSLIALQEMNLCFRYPIIFWNCACLITNAGGSEDEEESTNSDYDKIAKAIGKTQEMGIKIVPPDINNSKYTFSPDVKNNQILFGMKGMYSVGEDLVATIIQNRPYVSVVDFYNRIKPKKNAMISLIKSGSFDNLESNRKLVMGWYLSETSDLKNKVNLQNMASLIKYNLLPKDEKIQLALRVYEFNRYLKAKCKTNRVDIYLLDERAVDFMSKNNIGDNLIQNFQGNYLIQVKPWEKIYNFYMDYIRNYLKTNQAEVLQKLNDIIFKENWEKYATGNYSKWEMDSICFYYHEHELANINMGKYGIRKFSSLPEEPKVQKTFKKGNKTINIFELNRICGTCIAKDKNKGLVSLLTTTGVVTVKFSKDYFNLFDKQITEKDSNGVKHVLEKSWFNRGSKIVVMGIRRGDNFIPKKYAATPGHELYRITEVLPDGEIVLQTQRKAGIAEEDEEV